MDFSKLIEWIKLSPKYLLGIALICGFLLFAPIEWLKFLALESFVESIKPWLGVIFIVATTLLAVNLLAESWNWVKNYIKNKSTRKARIERLYQLTFEEKEILLGFILNQTKTQYLAYSDGVVNGLESAQIIYRSSNVGDLERWAFNIQPWAWKTLHEKFNEFFTNEDVSSFNTSKESPSYKSARRANPWL